MPAPPLISVVLPVYRVAQYLAECLASVSESGPSGAAAWSGAGSAGPSSGACTMTSSGTARPPTATPEAGGAKFRLVERGAYRTYSVLEPLNQARVALQRIAGRGPR